MIIGIDGNEANVACRVGANQYAFELLHALHDLPAAKKHEFIIYLRQNPLPDMPQLATWWKYKVFGPKRLWTQIALPISLFSGRERPNVFFSPGHYRPRWSPVPTVISIMDLGYLRFPGQFAKRDLMQLRAWTSISLKKANHIIAISQSTKNDIMKYYKIPSEKITTSYPGYDRKQFHTNIKVKKETLGKYGVNGEYILFLGTLKPSKNIEGIIEAFRLLGSWAPGNPKPKSLMTKEPNDLSLVISGKKGWLYGPIFQRVKDLGLQKRVVFTDFVEEDDKPVLIAGARVLVSPSFWEGFGIHLVEAMACGTPVVVSNTGSIPEVVGSAGVLVNPDDSKDIADGIKKVFVHREIYSKRGLERAKQFDWRKTADQTLRVLETVGKQV